MAAAVGEAEAWIEMEGVESAYIDLNMTVVELNLVGMTGDLILNYHNGAMTDSHMYGGVVTIGLPAEDIVA
ncbi:MAG: hypothetical protein ABFC80_00215 [Coriobacteriales bacterium]|nr:hypothetical protein [Actinomycetes bacterium]